MAIKPALNQFNGGEIQPQLEGRFDWQKFNYSAKLCKNFIPTVEGYLKRRGGSHYVATKRGVTQATFKFYVRTESRDDTPTLQLNGETVTLTNSGGQFFYIDTWETENYTYTDGEQIEYRATATGYVTKQGVLTVSDRQQDYTIEIYKPSERTATVKFCASPLAQVTLNSVVRTSITDTIGTEVTYSITWQGKTASGSVVIDGDKTYYVYINNDTLYVSGGELVKTSVAGSGTLYLPPCHVRVIAVGGGGGAFLYSDVYYGGGSGAGADVILKIPTGAYLWQCGALGTTGSNGINTYFSPSNEVAYITAGGGKTGKKSGKTFSGGAGGTISIKNSVVAKENWSKNGNACTYYSADRARLVRGGDGNIHLRHGTFSRGSLIRGASVYKGYGTASGYTTSDHNSYSAGTNGYLFIEFVGDWDANTF